jgi:hypothetical protein
MYKIFLVLILITATSIAKPSFETYFYNNYKLGQRAANIPGGEFKNPVSLNSAFSVELPEVQFLGNKVTERLQNFVPNNVIKSNEFAVEFWVLYHVNTEVGASVFMRDAEKMNKLPFSFGFYGNKVLIDIDSEAEKFMTELDLDSLAKSAIKGKSARDFSYKNWNYQFLLTYKNGKCDLFVNQQKVYSVENVPMPKIDKNTQVEIAAYLDNEPYMELSNLIRYFAYYDEVPNENALKDQYGLFTDV